MEEDRLEELFVGQTIILDREKQDELDLLKEEDPDEYLSLKDKYYYEVKESRRATYREAKKAEEQNQKQSALATRYKALTDELGSDINVEEFLDELPPKWSRGFKQGDLTAVELLSNVARVSNASDYNPLKGYSSVDLGKYASAGATKSSTENTSEFIVD